VQRAVFGGDAGFAQSRFVGGGRQGLRQRQRVAFGGRVIHALGLQARRAGAGVPAAELGEIRTRCVLHGGDEVFAGHGLAVVAGEVEVHALAEVVAADQGLDHADDLGALFVHRGGVEIVDLGVGGGADRVRHRPGIFGELGDAQGAHFLDARHGARVQVFAEFLVAIDGEAFLQRELEPVATGDAVAGPVVEVLVGDDAVDALVVGVGGGVGAGQHVLGVEDVEALVLHRPHVEVAHGDDHVVVEVHLQAEAFLVPFHGFLQRGHGVAALVELAGLDVYGAAHAAPRGGDEVVFQHIELRGYKREQVAGLGEGVFPLGPMPACAAAIEFACRDRVAVGKQLREARLVGLDGAGVARHHVGRSGKKVMRRKPWASHWVK
jgi:hypothetical protein